MYCEDSRGTDIDHFDPKSRTPECAFEWDNYLGACSTCNSNHKRDEFPCTASGQPLLLNPVRDEPLQHLTFTPSTGKYVAVNSSHKADESIRVFGMNRDDLAVGRRAAWTMLQAAVIVHARARDAGNIDLADDVKQAALLQPFAAVLEALIQGAHSTDPDRQIMPECRDALSRYPDIREWLATYR